MSLIEPANVESRAGPPELYDRSLTREPFEIRLVQVDRSDDRDAPVRCHLETYELNSAPAYRCVSYVWGKGDPDNTLLVNGVTVSATRNLVGFLERIRARSHPGQYYWIDALCINQNDRAEKSIHVAEMGRIYQTADLVIGWLGYEFDRSGTGAGDMYDEMITDDTGGTSHRGILFLKQLAEACRTWTESGGKPWPPSTQLSRFAFDDREMYTMLDIKRPPIETWRSVGYLLTRAWFKRTWVVQEATLARKLIMVCGFRDILWDDFVQVAVFLQASGWMHALMDLAPGPERIAIPPGWQVILFTSLQNMVGHFRSTADLGNIFTLPNITSPDDPTSAADILQFLVTETMPFEASDCRDKLYAPRSLVAAVYPMSEPRLPGVDYTLASTVVYIQYAGYLLQQSSSLGLLSYITTYYKKDALHRLREMGGRRMLPTWVPEFAGTITCPLFEVPGVNYNPLPGISKVCTWIQNRQQLEVEGFRLATIDRLAPPLEQLYDGGVIRPFIEFATDLLHAPPLFSPNIVDSFWRTLIADCDGSSCPASPDTAAAFKQYLLHGTAVERHGRAINPSLQPLPQDSWSAWSCFDTLHNSSPAAAAAIPSTAELADYAEQWRYLMLDRSHFSQAKRSGLIDFFNLVLARACVSRNIFVSDRGHLGLAPTPSQPGDQIWFLAGARVAMILRPAETETHFDVVGEAYVHGVMHGEMFAPGLARPDFERITLV